MAFANGAASASSNGNGSDPWAGWKELDTVDAQAEGDDWRRMILNELDDVRKRAKEGKDGVDRIIDTLPVIDSEDEEERDGEAENKTTRDPSNRNSLARRRYCPVVGCPESEQRSGRGFTRVDAFKNHMKEHAGGRLVGAAPQAWLKEFQISLQCNRLVALKRGGK